VRQVVDQVESGELSPGDRLPSAGELATSLDLNRNTVLRAYRELRDDGVVELRRGRGAIVVAGPNATHPASPQMEAALDRLAAIARESSVPLSDLIAGLTIRGVQ
ncbi:MAG TPA: GntR family transcriptional regulator, partial [Actinomycetales bacterium]|nr:GntR family transcriptional regulator [Actinomycetales bacterium]